MPGDEGHGFYVPLGDVLNRIENSLSVIRDKLDGKADVVRLMDLEKRVSDLERDSVSQEAVTAAVHNVRANRSRVWMAMGLAIFGQILNVVLYLLVLRPHH